MGLHSAVCPPFDQRATNRLGCNSAMALIVLVDITETGEPTFVAHDASSLNKADEAAAVHSITSSARASSVGGTFMPSAFAVLRLMTSSNFVGCSAGISG